mgnify:FL=1
MYHLIFNHPCLFYDRKAVFGQPMIEYARHLPYEIGSAFVAVWGYNALGSVRPLKDACAFLSDAIASGVVEGNAEVARKMQSSLTLWPYPAWEDHVLVAIAEGGMERLMWALSEIEAHIAHETNNSSLS